MGIIIDNIKGLDDAITKGYTLHITYSSKVNDPLDIHSQIYVPKVGIYGCGIVYEAIFHNKKEKIQSDAEIIDKGNHKELYDFDEYPWTERDFILVKRNISLEEYKDIKEKYEHKVQNISKYAVLAYPELEPSVVNRAATKQKIASTGYPEYSCHSFSGDTIKEALNTELVSESNRDEFFKIYQALYDGSTTIFKRSRIDKTMDLSVINKHINECPSSRAATALFIYNENKSNGIGTLNTKLINDIYTAAYENSKLFDSPSFIFSDQSKKNYDVRMSSISKAISQ